MNFTCDWCGGPGTGTPGTFTFVSADKKHLGASESETLDLCAECDPYTPSPVASG